MRKYLILILVCLVATPAAATMTSDTDKEILECNGETGPYSYGFKIWNDDDIKVIQTDGNNVDTLLTLTSDYTVSGAGDDAGGFVTLVTACPDGSTLTLIPVLDYTQESDYIDGAPFAASTIENDLDYTVSLSKQNAEAIDRAIKFPESCKNCDDIDLERPANDAYLLYNSDGTAIINSTSLTSTVTVAEIDNIDDYANVTAVSVVVGNKEIIVHKSVNVDADALTIPSNVVLQFTKEGRFVTGTYDITLASCPKAGPYQIFDVSGGGSVDLSNGACENVYSEWWGADASDSTSDVTAIQAALDTNSDNSHVKLLVGTYTVDSEIVVNQDNWLEGQGRGSTVLNFTGSSGQAIRVVNSGGVGSCANRVRMNSFGVTAAAGSEAYTGIRIDTACTSEFYGIDVLNFSSGIGFQMKTPVGGASSINVHVEDVRAFNCLIGFDLDSENACGAGGLITEVTFTKIKVYTAGGDGGFTGVRIGRAAWLGFFKPSINTDDTTPTNSWGIRFTDSRTCQTNITIDSPVVERVETGIDVGDSGKDIRIFYRNGASTTTEVDNDDDIVSYVRWHSATDDNLVVPAGTQCGYLELGHNSLLKMGHIKNGLPTRSSLVADTTNNIEGVIAAIDLIGDNDPRILMMGDSSYGCDTDNYSCMSWRQIFSGSLGSFTCDNDAQTTVTDVNISSSHDLIFLTPKDADGWTMMADPYCGSGHTDCGVQVSYPHTIGNADPDVSSPAFTVDHPNVVDHTGAGGGQPDYYYMIINTPDNP